MKSTDKIYNDLSMQNMEQLTITIDHYNYQWILKAYSFEHGVTLAENLHNKLGLIGRTYITSSCGKQTWIR